MKICLYLDAGSVVGISPWEEYELIYREKDARSLPYYTF
jgi:hypothetical protein